MDTFKKYLGKEEEKGKRTVSIVLPCTLAALMAVVSLSGCGKKEQGNQGIPIPIHSSDIEPEELPDVRKNALKERGRPGFVSFSLEDDSIEAIYSDELQWRLRKSDDGGKSWSEKAFPPSFLTETTPSYVYPNKVHITHAEGIYHALWVEYNSQDKGTYYNTPRISDQ